VRIKELVAFMVERHSVYLNKTAGLPKPWTNDPILQQYRFCNIHREHDTETLWLKNNWRKTYLGNYDTWFAMMVARFINWHESLELFMPLPFDPEEVKRILCERRANGDKVFTGAYTISTNGLAVKKIEYVVDYVLTPAWEVRAEIRPRTGDTLASFASQLLKLNGISGFMAGQIVGDEKYIASSPLVDAADWYTWSLSGPGSRRGMSRVCERDHRESITESAWQRAMSDLLPKVNEALSKDSKFYDRYAPIHAQDLQNSLCEFDKYERVRLGEGRPRATYRGAR